MTKEALARQIREEIKKENQKPVIRFTLEPGEPDLCGSKVGGTPYLPHDMPWPLDTQGLPMTFLAQVDCTALQGLEDFPQNGLLQFFVGQNYLYGADFDNITKSGNFLVQYHETADPSVTADEVQAKRPAVPDDTQHMTPLYDICRICFRPLERQEITDSDYYFEKRFFQKWNALCPEEPLEEIEFWDFLDDWKFHEMKNSSEIYHWLGGYPDFFELDPRRDGGYPELDVLLFHLESDLQDGRPLVVWEEYGMANFLISRQDLQKRDFSKTGYIWDAF